MELSNPQKKKLKGIAHDLHPIVTIAQKGLTEAIHDEIETSLKFHQLIKVKVIVDDREQRKEIIHSIADKHQADIIQTIGHVAVFFRRNKEKANILST